MAIAYFGDGATSEGAFHEGANFAAVMRAPLVLFCNNNRWAISTPVSAQTAAETLADKAVGYGMPGVRVDGGDVLAVYEATREAVERARAGDGPTFIEAVTYRAAPHATADDPRRTSTWSASRRRSGTSASGATRRYLRRLGILTDEMAEAIRAEAADSMRAGIAAAEAEPPADLGAPLRARASPTRRRRSPADLAELRTDLRASRWPSCSLSRRSTTASTERRATRRDGDGRGRRPRRRRLPRDGRSARPLRPDRCVDTPLAEAGIIGTAIGLCMAGWRPVCEMQYDAFCYPCSTS